MTAATQLPPTDEPGTRDRILASARRLFAERGYAATSLSDIAADVGLTKTAVAYHVHPKEQLLVEVVAPALRDLAAELGPLPTGTDEQRSDFLRHLVVVLVRHRDVIGILAADTALLGRPSISAGLGGVAPRDLLAARLLPPDPTPHQVVRAWAALGAIQVAVARTVDQPTEVVLEVATAAALAAYSS